MAPKQRSKWREAWDNLCEFASRPWNSFQDRLGYLILLVGIRVILSSSIVGLDYTEQHV